MKIIRNKQLLPLFILLAGLQAWMSFGWPGLAVAQENDDCFMCHEDTELTKQRDGREVSLYINPASYENSVHGEMECIYCHADLDGAEFPHEENLAPVDCGLCHDEIADIYSHSLHGEAVARGEKLAPRCWDCHGSHDILAHDNPKSKVEKFNIPFMCGRCHKEGTEVTRTYDIPQDSILAHYSLSIHGRGLFQQGLTVTAVCNDCHTSHNVLPHTDPGSSIHRDNVAGTCQKCHGRIEEVHKKVIKGELWEKEPNKIPVCVDCHAPHEIRRVLYEEGMSDEDCLKCHGKKDLTGTRDGQTVSMYVNVDSLHNSTHRQTSCAQCHTGATRSHERRPCATVVERVDCSICHSEAVVDFVQSTHGQLVDRGDPDAPYCTDCHGDHQIMSRQNPASPTYPINVPTLCADCHREGGIAAERYQGEMIDIVKNYTMSIHGKGLLESGLVVTAMCTDCHTAHKVLPKVDTASSVNPRNIPETCADCHHGIYEQYSQSIHHDSTYSAEKNLPTCSDCHESHTIMRADMNEFRFEVINQCGRCHEDVTETYFETFHGKVSKLGYANAAKCSDCHGAHNILPVTDPKSTLARDNIVETCGQCHPGSHRQFAGYLTHATHHDKDKYPFLYYTFWFMTILLIGTFSFFGLHTILWLPRSFQAMAKTRQIHKASRTQYQYRRFKRLHRQLHFLVIISFLGLAVTGMTLKFSYLGWAQWISELLGGFESAGYIHRICAVITFFYFFAHIYDLVKSKRKKRVSWKEYLTGPNSMLPNRKDLSDFIGTIKWFVGMGPRPGYGRWTYWEKFDYFAVFWGVAVIGFTGLMLWFPEFFTRFLPGWIINVATIIHSDEALLATGFIFTVHFFNTHFRPDKFPMDPVIFTGRVPLEEFKEDRPEEYAELTRDRKLKKHLVEPLPDAVVNSMKVFGFVALSIGLILIVLIIYAEVFSYR